MSDSALLAATDATKNLRVGDATAFVSVADIVPNRRQPRREFSAAALEELAQSVRTYGVLQPLLVRKLHGEKYELIAGERRLRAAKAAGLAVVPVLVREYGDAAMGEVALVENVQRENLNIIEEAEAYWRLMTDFALTQEQLSRKIGKSRSHIANVLRLLKLSPNVRKMLALGELSMGQAKPLLALPKSLQEQAANIIVAKKLSARQAERLAKQLIKDSPPAPKDDAAVYIRDAEERLTRCFGAKVRIIAGKKKSSLCIDFYSTEDLTNLVERLTAETTEINSARKMRRVKEFTV